MGRCGRDARVHRGWSHVLRMGGLARREAEDGQAAWQGAHASRPGAKRRHASHCKEPLTEPPRRERGGYSSGMSDVDRLVEIIVDRVRERMQPQNKLALAPRD